jgi:hypothetical protein
MARLFRAAEVLYRCAPWRVASDSEVLRADIRAVEVGGATAWEKPQGRQPTKTESGERRSPRHDRRPLFSRGPMACEPRATCALVVVAHGAVACRTTRARCARCETVNVAWLDASGDPASRSISSFTHVRSDIPKRACRSGSSRSATFEPLHVARDRRGVRHSSPCMSPDALVKGDMAARPCRLTHVCRATCVDAHVALPARPERHGARCMSLDPRGHLSIHGPAERHVRPPMSLHATAECDMGAQACGCTREGQATFPRGKPRTPVRRAAGSAFSKTRRSANIARGPDAACL